jgi:hypothetical protein
VYLHLFHSVLMNHGIKEMGNECARGGYTTRRRVGVSIHTPTALKKTRMGKSLGSNPDSERFTDVTKKKKKKKHHSV